MGGLSFAASPGKKFINIIHIAVCNGADLSFQAMVCIRLRSGGWSSWLARQKNSQDPHLSRRMLGMVVHDCHPSHSGKQNIGGLQSRLAWEKSGPVYNNQSTKGWEWLK
jgi:hypothetical protein